MPTMLLDEWLPASPKPTAVERHRTHVRAPVAAVYAALWRADLGGPALRALLGLRALPAALGGSPRARERMARLFSGRERLTLREIVRAGFTVLADSPDREVVLGLTGRFWTIGSGVVPTAAAEFQSGPPPGHAQAAWNFSLAASPAGGTWLTTETRVRCPDAGARRRFRAYWLVVRPWSGLSRRLMLRAIRREAERRDAPASRPKESGA
jgi:hypothetical protein